MDTSSLPIRYVDTNSPVAAVEKVIDIQEEVKYKAEYGELGYWWMRYGEKIKLACGALVVLILMGILFGNGGGSSGGVETDKTGSITEAISEWWADGM